MQFIACIARVHSYHAVVDSHRIKVRRIFSLAVADMLTHACRLNGASFPAYMQGTRHFCARQLQALREQPRKTAE
jgi:hypothetical protein